MPRKKLKKKQNSSRNQPLPGRMIHLRSATADQAALIPRQNREQAVAVCNPYRDPEGGLLFFKGHTAPADKPLVPSKAGCSPPVNPGSLITNHMAP